MVAKNERAVVYMKVGVLVEVSKSSEYYKMVAEAEEKLRKHIVPGKGFFPFRSEADMTHDDTTVDELVQKLTVQPGTGWDK